MGIEQYHDRICLATSMRFSNSIGKPTQATVVLLAAVIAVWIGSALGATFSPNSKVDDLASLRGFDTGLVMFYAPWCGHCKALAPEWEKAAAALDGFVRVAAVDMDANPSEGAPYGVTGFPTVFFFGDNKASPEKYTGARTAEPIVDWALRQAKTVAKARLGGKSSSSSSSSSKGKSGSSSDVVELTASNFDDVVMDEDKFVFVEYYAPWCGHCKKLAPEWERLATKLKGKVVVAAIDATAHQDIGQRFGIQGFPTIKMFAPGAKRQPIDYQGPRTTKAMAEWALDLAAVPIEVVEVTSADVFAKECRDLCFVAVLPHILDSGASGRNAYLDLLKTVAENNKGNPFTWVWMEAGAQWELEERLNIGGAGYPALATINVAKEKYVTFVGAFSSEQIEDHIKRVMNGRARAAALPPLPAIADTTPWDGKDGVPPGEDY